jgi:capsular exopolysaccharide synthesis family protein
VTVTSPAAGDGKTLVAIGLAAALAESGRRVLLVDANLRQPRLHEIFGVAPEGAGLVSAGSSAAGEGAGRAIRRTSIPRLDVLVAGAPVPDPAGLLAGTGVRSFLARAAASYDRIVLDAPPLWPFADAGILLELAPHAVVVVRSGATTREAARRAGGILEAAGHAVQTAVLNVVDAPPGDDDVGALAAAYVEDRTARAGPGAEAAAAA